MEKKATTIARTRIMFARAWSTQRLAMLIFIVKQITGRFFPPLSSPSRHPPLFFSSFLFTHSLNFINLYAEILSYASSFYFFFENAELIQKALEKAYKKLLLKISENLYL